MSEHHLPVATKTWNAREVNKGLGHATKCSRQGQRGYDIGFRDALF